jgi:hypothetical protein
MLAHSKNQEERDMEELDKKQKNKGGRPAKAIKKSRVLTLKCSNYERMIIHAKAKKVNLSPRNGHFRESKPSGKGTSKGSIGNDRDAQSYGR